MYQITKQLIYELFSALKFQFDIVKQQGICSDQ